MPPQMGAPMSMPMKHPSEGPLDDEPSNKKIRNEDSLVPEEVFMSRNPVYRNQRFIFIGLIIYFLFLESCCY